MPEDRKQREQVLVQVVDVRAGREIGAVSKVAERLRDRLDDVQGAIVAGAETTAASLPELPSAADWNLQEVSAKFGIALTAEAGVVLTQASAAATFEVTITFHREG